MPTIHVEMFAGRTVETVDFKPVKILGLLRLDLELWIDLGPIFWLRHSVGFDRRQHKNVITPNHRCRAASTDEFSLPFDVGIRIPLDGRVCVIRGYAIG